ncbi:MAG: LacI family DNA-binding transcriptional regulator [Victivallaceae bacterium]|nr:LacI family DNA-binding transcriptional regulator [Victivallaceae bacterium]
MARPSKKINIRHIADAAGVSVATVSRVINNRTDVSESLRKKVRTVIENCNFCADRGEERLFHLVMAIVGGTGGEYASLILEGAIRYGLESRSAPGILFFREEVSRKRSLLRLLRERRVDGVGIISSDNYSHLEGLSESGIPCILVNQEPTGNFGGVGNDSYGGMGQAIEYLISLGHRKIGFLEGELDGCIDHCQRKQAYLDGMHRNGLAVPDSYLVLFRPTSSPAESGYIQMNRLLDAAGEITAAAVNNDEMAVGAIKACRERGLDVPRDISIIGFDDRPLSRFLHPGLSTVRQPLEELGYHVMHALDDFLQHKINELPREILKTELVVRGTTAPPRRRNA